jgi:UDP-N-acetylmuramyl pentapeptide phosphotransferase/UDP-N-acetylglucosamine-1-phosphate transferase
LLSLLTVIAASAMSALLTYGFVRWSEHNEIVAEENHRSMHKGRVPVGGGLPLLAAALSVAFLIWPLDRIPYAVGLALALLVVVSWADDRQALNATVRLAAHLVAAAAAVLSLPGDAYVFQGVLPFALDRLVAAIAVAWFINLYNFMDGIDGIAGSETAAISAGYAAIIFAAGADTEPLYGLALAIFGATAGFLVWNWSPARIFMGDVGSVPLGFLMAVMMLDLAIQHSFAAALILPLYFAADATITLLKRILAGEKPWEAHRSHYYQRAALKAGSHARIVGYIIICNAVLMILAVLALSGPGFALALAVAATAALLYVLDRQARAGS